MRRALIVLSLLVLTAGEPAAATSPPGPPGSSVAASHPVPALIPRPPVCDDYRRLEAGGGEIRNQDWFNHLDARGYARVRSACVYGWGTAEYACLTTLWNEEHGWQTSGDGIPQAQPRSKMAAAGPDWRWNPRTQIRWGLAYISGRYGRPTRASLRGRPCHAGY